MTRRQLARLAAAGSTAFLAQASADSTYTGALDGVESKVDGAAFDPVLLTKKLYASAPLRMTFRAGTRKQAEAWQKQLRPKLAELLGGFPESRVPLRPQTLEVREFPAYTREKVVFEAGRGRWCWLIC